MENNQSEDDSNFKIYHSKVNSMIDLMSKLFVLLICSNLVTIMLVILIIFDLIFEFGIWQITIHFIFIGLDSLVNMLVIYSQFDFGDILYLRLCNKCHNFMTIIWKKKIMDTTQIANGVMQTHSQDTATSIVINGDIDEMTDYQRF